MILELSHITKSFGNKVVLKDVSFHLNDGSISILMGVNGSGKTTLFNIISGFLNPDSGEISLNKKEIKGIREYKINRRGVSRTFQDLRLIGNLTVRENILLAFPNQQGEKWLKILIPNKKVKQEQETNNLRANEILKICFIEDIAESKASEISYGQQKLLNLSCAIANDAEVLLLDEPVAGVNQTYRDKLVSVIKNIKAEGKSILIIEHNTDFIEAVADRLFFLNEGKIKEFETYENLRNDKIVQEAYI